MCGVVCDEQGNHITEFGIKVLNVIELCNLNTTEINYLYELLLFFKDQKTKVVRVKKMN